MFKRVTSYPPARIALVYAIGALVTLVIIDLWNNAGIGGVPLWLRADTLADFVFVGVSAVTLYGLLDHEETRRKAADAELRQRNRELETLLSMSNVLLGNFDLQVVLDGVALAARELVPGADRASLWLYDKARLTLVMRASTDMAQQTLLGTERDIDHALVKDVFGQRAMLRIDDTSKLDDFAPISDDPSEQPKSVIAMPMIVEGEVTGYLFADSSTTTHAFHDANTRILETLSAQAGLAIHNASLYERMQTELAERKAADKALRASEARLRELGHRVVLAQEVERQRLARDLHDGLGQMIAAAKIRLTMAARSITRNVPGDQEKLDALAAMLDDMVKTVRALSQELHPPLLREVGWKPALEWLCETASQQEGIKIGYTHAGPVVRMANAVEVGLFRIVQEAVANSVKHAYASTISVTSRMARGGLIVEVVDDGAGFNLRSIREATQPGVGLGLLAMQERAEAIGAKLNIRSTTGKGTRVSVRLAISREGKSA